MNKKSLELLVDGWHITAVCVWSTAWLLVGLPKAEVSLDRGQTLFTFDLHSSVTPRALCKERGGNELQNLSVCCSSKLPQSCSVSLGLWSCC